MTKTFVLILALVAGAAAQTPGGRPLHSEEQRLARWRPVMMTFQAAGLSARQRQMVEKLVEACQSLDNVYWRQSDLGGLALYKATRNPTLKSLFSIMGGRWDIADDNRFFSGEKPIPPGRQLYPQDLTRASLEQYLKQHPEDRAAIYDPYTVVKRKGDRLIGVPYHEEYQRFVQPMAQALRDAAALSDDAAFAGYLRLRADALLSDDYYKSDLAWLDLKDPKIDVIFGPQETYIDELLGVKTSYGASILIRNPEESAKLAVYQKYVPEIQDALPLEAANRPSMRGHVMPMEVMDAPYRAGDLRYGYQAVADSLPNNSPAGTKVVFFKNFMDARVTNVVLPIARRLVGPAQAAQASSEGYLTCTLMHEIAHGLGPVARGSAIGPVYSALEEAKADAAGMFALEWLVGRGVLPKERLPEYYASYAAGILRTLRFGTAEAHGRAEMMEFNYLVENQAVSRTAEGRYAIDYARIGPVLAQLAKELLQMEAAGDRSRVEAWFAKYGKMPAELRAALAATADIPVDIQPIFSFRDKLE